MSFFRPAVKQEAKLRLAIAGPSGSGKTYTALNVATHLAGDGKIAVVDTEHGSASKYAGDLFQFDVVNFDAPFHPARFVEAIRHAEDAGYKVLIIDSISHAWNGAGGILEMVEVASKKYKGNSYAAWGDVTPDYNRLIESIVGAKLHIIITMRSKQDYILVERNGKQVPQKVGMAPIMRDGFEYEADVFLEMDIENNAIVSKTRCTALAGAVIPKPGRELAETLREWLSDGAPPPTEDELRTQAIKAQTVEEFTRAAYRLRGPRHAFETQQRLADWYHYVTGNGFVPQHNEEILRILDTYANNIADGARVRDAADTAQKTYQGLVAALNGAGVDEEE